MEIMTLINNNIFSGKRYEPILQIMGFSAKLVGPIMIYNTSDKIDLTLHVSDHGRWWWWWHQHRHR
jgi:hypothetical protein